MKSKKKASAGKTAAKTKSFILTDKSPFSVKEAYKALRTNVTFSLPGNDAKCIGLTSAERAEGKSTNAINLGIAFAQVGKRVIILDCDMRLPTVAIKLGTSSRPGLSDLLVGESVPEEVIRTVQENLDILPAGQIPKDPTGLLASDMMAKLIESLRKVYDYIIIDLPPVTTVTDAAILSSQIDGFLLVVRHEATDHRDIQRMLRQLELAEAKILGFIYNDAPVDQKKYYSHYYA